MPTQAKSSQEFVPIEEIRDGVIILKDGSIRGVLMTSSLNFALKSEENQRSIIFQFQNFMNSLDFSIQIFIQSRKLDIRPYIALLEQRYKEQKGELFKLQTSEYIDFIKNFTENANIMTKSFFVIVPYATSVVNKKKINFASSLFRKKNNEESALLNTQANVDKFDEAKSQLSQRMSVVEQGLTRSGIRVVRLGTEEIVELFYRIFNPGDSEKPLQV